MNTSDYISVAESQLSDGRFYKEVSTDLTERHTLMVNTYLEGLTQSGQITTKLKNKLITVEPKTPHFYLLPKIHKGGNPPPGRPIVSANACATKKISALVDIILRPLVPKIPSYIKDTGHFLNTIQQIGHDLPKNTPLHSRCQLRVYQHPQ